MSKYKYHQLSKATKEEFGFDNQRCCGEHCFICHITGRKTSLYGDIITPKRDEPKTEE